MSVIVDFAIFPMDKGESLSPYVAKAIKEMVKENELFSPKFCYYDIKK